MHNQVSNESLFITFQIAHYLTAVNTYYGALVVLFSFGLLLAYIDTITEQSHGSNIDGCLRHRTSGDMLQLSLNVIAMFVLYYMHRLPEGFSKTNCLLYILTILFRSIQRSW